MKAAAMKISLPLSFVFLLATGCVSEIDREIDCFSICERYEDCLPGDQDQAACRDRCDDRSPGEVDECDACLDASTCAECTFECAGPLSGA
ncbi:MAG: hypothetical protein KC619_31840 [Myxococcales bacterium]|nr:hypothetical protein [Myxococcales bacterium]